MLTEVEISAYAEEMRRAEEEAVGGHSGHWQRLRERRLVRSRENRVNVAEWYREYEEETGTLLGCD